MPVISINVGPKRVHLTAYCPDDELGLLACDYVLARAAVLLSGTTEAELRRWLIERDPAIAELFAKLDAGWSLPKIGDFTVDPSNAPAEARIIRHLLRERIEQCAGRPAHELAMNAAGPIVAPAARTSAAERATGCCRNKDDKDEPAGSKRCGKESTEVSSRSPTGRTGVILDLDAGGLRHRQGALRLAARGRAPVPPVAARRAAAPAHEPPELGDQQPRQMGRGSRPPLPARSTAAARRRRGRNEASRASATRPQVLRLASVHLLHGLLRLPDLLDRRGSVRRHAVSGTSPAGFSHPPRALPQQC